MSSELSSEVRFGSQEGRTFASYAVIRPVSEGTLKVCPHDFEPITFNAHTRPKWVIANMYGPDGKWIDNAYFHPACYREMGDPFGEPFVGQPLRTLEERQAAGLLLPEVSIDFILKVGASARY